MNWLKRWLTVWIPVAALILSVLGGAWSVLGAVWAASGGYAKVRAVQVRQDRAIEELGEESKCQDERIRSSERAISAMAENVRLTREAVERIETRMIGGPP